MSNTVGRPGQITITRATCRCEACEDLQPQRCISLAGPNGYVTLCFHCAARWFLQASIDESGRGMRAFGVDPQ